MKGILKKLYVGMWTELKFFRVTISGDLVWTRSYSSWF